jgi:UDP-N-acetylglucosamine 2-epimerase (non-hydrolysing)
MNPFTAADRPDGSAHEVLLLAGTRPEAARLAPVAAAMAARGRIRPVLVAAGSDPFRVDDALESFGTPADVLLLLGEPPRRKVGLAAGLAVRFDELMADREPSAVVVTGGGIAAVVGTQVAFWNRIPVVYLEPGPEAPEQPCPFPDGGNRRVIGQLTSLFLRVSDAGAPGGADAITVGDTMATAPLADPCLAELAERAAAGLNRVAVLDARTASVVAAADGLLAAHPDLHIVFLGDPGSAARDRVTVLADAELPDVLGLLRIATVGATDRPSAYREASDFGLPSVLVGRGRADEPAAGVVPARADAVLAALNALLDGHPGGIVRAIDHEAAYRVEHALAWMFGLAPSPAATGVGSPAAAAGGPSGTGTAVVVGPAGSEVGAGRGADTGPVVSWLPSHRP